ncbi:MAG TPA: ABC transporter substrate-binding protein [Bacteroidales bacterium]|nr:ABC transporter substrate-binding protein [Bacteroidales bacterium]HNW22377.1 ABC transporter substrate-binding protein [Bacteroidales bacterium]HNZ46522.1 ABC transporter substrate-binding protein [Bacteroidales bacterium]HOD55803.1 ABC transporter substrate-binding protein [Bacteroidales bacterium]HOF75053.1 ABC transporter substrate-binding protein [Bacteroidales bacterium]
MVKPRMIRGSLIGTCVLLCTLAFQSCPTNRSKSFRKHPLEEYGLSEGDIDYIYKPRYANNFYIVREEGEKVLYLTDPVTYNTTRHVVNKVRNVVCLSSTHIAYLDAINETSSIVGVSGAQYIYNKNIRKAVDLGYESAIDYEALLQLKPDIVFAYAIHGESADYIEKIKQLGLNVVQIPEYLENHPLGKAEFLVAFASFFDKELMAIEQFSKISHTYLEYCKLAKETVTTQNPAESANGGFEPVKVLVNAPFKDVWYVPGTDSHLQILVKDAGGMILGSKPGVKTTAMSVEQAYLYAQQADFWINTNQYEDLASLARLDPRFAEAPAFRNGNVWNNNLRSTPEGGSDYFESGAVNPHLILADLIAIFYPQALPKHMFNYYRKVGSSEVEP